MINKEIWLPIKGFEGLYEVSNFGNVRSLNYNNQVDNLEWCDAKYNSNYGTRNERISKPVLQFSKTGELVREWPSIREAGRNGFNNGAVVSCCNGKKQSHKGYIWRYK